MRPVRDRVELSGLRRALLARGTVALPLGPLAEPQAVDLVAGLVGAQVGPGLRRLAATAGGNPMFIHELVDAQRHEQCIRVARGVAELADGDAAVVAPTSLAGAVDIRLRWLGPETRSLLRWAALLGTEFAAVDLATVAGRPATEVVTLLEQAVAGGLVVESGVRLAFRHPLFRQALYDAIPADERAALHRRAARSLADAGSPADRVAPQLLASAPPVEDWVRTWLGGTLPALALRAPTLAAELTERALDGMTADDPRREQLVATLVTVLRLLARYDDVERVARPLLAAATDPACAGQTAWALAFALAAAGRSAEGVEVAEDALRRWPAIVPWAARLRALLALLVRETLHRSDPAVSIAEQAVAEGERIGDRFAVAFGLHVLAFTEASTSAALAHLDRALIAVGDFLEGADLRLLLYSNKMTLLMVLGRPRRSRPWARRSCWPSGPAPHGC